MRGRGSWRPMPWPRIFLRCRRWRKPPCAFWPIAAQTSPPPVLADFARAVETHPDVLLMPLDFMIVERTDNGLWCPCSGLQGHRPRRPP
ncbi:DUF5954 family protein [Streptomyces sp. NPDC101158]|uniref:DUF5954 family protein n=1 Tax=Streptomyces sp. NPDC101158 TaxID=3366117 RepID=UPI00380BA4A1